MKPRAPLANILPPLYGPEETDPSPRRRRTPITAGATADDLAAWARAAARQLGAVGDAAVLDRVERIARDLVADALEHGIAPMTLEVTVTRAAVEIAVGGARSVAYRSIGQSPQLTRARATADRWRIRTGPDGRGSTLTATVLLTPRGPVRRLLRALGRRPR